MKKIVLLSPAHPLRGGIASSSERLAAELQDSGYEVIIYTFSLQYPNFLFPGKTQFSDDPKPENLDIHIKVNSVNPANWLSIGKELQRIKPDLIITRYWLPFMAPSLGSIIRLAKKNKHTKAIAIADNIIPHEKRPGDRQLTQYFVNSVDGFIVMSKSVKEEMKQFTAIKPVEYIPHPIYDNYGDLVSKEAALAHLNLEKGVEYALFFGFIRDYKGLDLLLNALADARLKKRNLKLIVAGEYYGNEATYQAIIKAKNLDNQVIMHTKYIPSEEVKYYFGAADLVVQPYKTATQSGISQLAYHFEKPMVVTNVGGLPEIVEDGKAGYVVEVSETAIADAIFDFFDTNQVEKLTAGVIENKEQFSWKNMVEGLERMEKIIY